MDYSSLYLISVGVDWGRRRVDTRSFNSVIPKKVASNFSGWYAHHIPPYFGRIDRDPIFKFCSVGFILRSRSKTAYELVLEQDRKGGFIELARKIRVLMM